MLTVDVAWIIPISRTRSVSSIIFLWACRQSPISRKPTLNALRKAQEILGGTSPTCDRGLHDGGLATRFIPPFDTNPNFGLVRVASQTSDPESRSLKAQDLDNSDRCYIEHTVRSPEWSRSALNGMALASFAGDGMVRPRPDWHDCPAFRGSCTGSRRCRVVSLYWSRCRNRCRSSLHRSRHRG